MSRKPRVLSIEASEFEPFCAGLAHEMRRYRLKKGVSIKRLADRADVSVSTIVGLEREALTPRIYQLHRIANALGCEIDIAFVPMGVQNAAC